MARRKESNTITSFLESAIPLQSALPILQRKKRLGPLVSRCIERTRRAVLSVFLMQIVGAEPAEDFLAEVTGHLFGTGTPKKSFALAIDDTDGEGSASKTTRWS